MAARVLLMPACLTAQSRLSSHCCSRNQTLGVSRTIQRVVSFQVNAAWAKGPSARLPAGTLGGSGPIPRNPFSVISQGTNYRGATTRIIGMVFEICRNKHIPSEIIPRPAKLTLRIIPMWPTIATTIALVTPSQLKHSPSITL